jgi:ubiquinone/menaquinone biosynthesis C-methylase UbiE
MPLDVKHIWDACGEAFNRYTTASDSFSENIERPAVEQLIGDLNGARLLDLGCGSGPFSLRFAEKGSQVVGLDLSPTMIALAKEQAHERSVQADFRVADIREPLPFEDSAFDAVFTGTVLHYVENLPSFMKEVARVMKAPARFVASVLHPVSTARFPLADAVELEGPDPWEDCYFGPRHRAIETPWLGFGEVSSEGRRIYCYHHTISDYFNSLAAAGLAIRGLSEPGPPSEFATKNPSRYAQAMRLPVFLILRADKLQ